MSSSKRDYYEILGIAKSASQDEIKKAYRKKAIEFHPDRNPGDKAAEDKFKECAEAYEILADADKKRMYDQYGHAAFSGGMGGGAGFSSVDDIFEHFGSIFEDFFGFSNFGGSPGGNRKKGGGSRARRGNDLRYDLHIDFKESVLGVEKKIEVPRQSSCEKCKGKGAVKDSDIKTCSRCNGYGQVALQQGFFSYATTCPDCKGKGKAIANPCGDCSGSGVTVKTSKITVKIPAGIDSGMRLRIPNEGEGGQNGGPAGDLYVFLEVDEHNIFKREEFDLIYPLEISVAQAILGTEIEIDCFEETPRKITLPAGVQPGERIVVKGAGVPKIEKYGKGKGDLVIIVNVWIPKKVTKEAEEHLRAFAKIQQEKTKEDSSGFFERIFG